MDLLTEEMRRVLIMTGTPSVRDISESMLIAESSNGRVR
jgi:isopentenyl diphosphate isomerase/L-lactate dehydrogenase-like FMN-dependent dehydrogenase